MLLSCPLCCKPHFEGVDSLRTTLISVATAPLTCPVCQETLNGLDKLTIHLFGHVNISISSDSAKKGKNVSVSTSMHPCNEGIKEEIDESINQISVKTNQRTETEPRLNISKPQEIITNRNEVITCDICSFTFTDRNILDMHQKLLHQTTPDEKTGKYSYHCHLCSKRFRMRGSLMVHLRVAHYGFSSHIDVRPHLPNDSENKLENGQENEIMKTESAGKNTTQKPQDCKQWSCDVCEKLFTTKYFLKKHKRLHTGEMPYSCTICNKSFTFQQSYHKHMLYHSSEKPYVCNECGRAFKEHSTLQNHARIHSGERPFGCENCGKRFRQRVSYLVHMRIHTGVMPYKCTACDKSFRYKVSQRSHKCPINPPGSVIRISDADTSSSLPVSLRNLVVNDNNLPTPQNNESGVNTTMAIDNLESRNVGTAAKCIMTVDYDTGNINLIPETVLEARIKCNTENTYQENYKQAIVLKQENDDHHKLIDNSFNKEYLLRQRDEYSIVMSPILSEVESLCINNNSPLSDHILPTEENIQTIREKCLEELFK